TSLIGEKPTGKSKKLSEDTVMIHLKGEKGSIPAKIDKLAELLGVDQAKIKELQKEGGEGLDNVLDNYVHGRLQAKLILGEQGMKENLVMQTLTANKVSLKDARELIKQRNEIKNGSNAGMLIHTDDRYPPIPRSILSIPNGPHQGTWALL